ncbi:hypothetical protein Trydic_g7580 [Trypoxylus dichotomus]
MNIELAPIEVFSSWLMGGPPKETTSPPLKEEIWPTSYTTIHKNSSPKKAHHLNPVIFQTELSHNLQQLSERARSTTEFIQRLKGMSDKVNENCEEFESIVTAQCENLIAAIHARRAQLMECIRQDKDLRIRALKDQVATCTARLQHTTALLQFCIEALKETDSAAFLQVGSMLISRVANTDHSWHKEWSAPRVSPHFDLTLDDKSVLRAIDQLNFIQMKPPAAPIIIPEECSAENNSVTVAWQPPPQSHVEGYVLELDDGNGGDFRVSIGMFTFGYLGRP